MKVTKLNYVLILLTFLFIGCSDNIEDFIPETENIITEESKNRLNVDTNDFYKEPESFSIIKNLVTDYGVNNNDNNNDSPKLQEAIDDISNQLNGNTFGKLIIPNGNYYFTDIVMKSNITIEIDQNAVLFSQPGIKRNQTMFRFGDRGPRITNAAIIGKGKGFTVDLRRNPSRNLIVCAVRDVRNFKISNFTIEDKNSVFASILVDIGVINGVANWSKDGIIEKIKQNNALRGYGLIQAYAANNVYFNNLDCDGGVTLRIETDNLAMKSVNKGRMIPNIGGVNDIVAKKIISRNGLAALMLSPHFMENGTVTAGNIRSFNSSFAVRIERGFVEIFAANNSINGNQHRTNVESQFGAGSVEEVYKRGGGIFAARLTPAAAANSFAIAQFKAGTFSSNTRISNIKATYGTTGQLNFNHRLYLPCEERNSNGLCKERFGKDVVFHGPSLAAVYDNTIPGNGPDSEGSYNVNTLINSNSAIGFPNNGGNRIKIDHTTPLIRGRKGCRITFTDCN
ncbi:Iota-carrageenase [uncultured Aquimarina sp.]|uniref:Iota-carrageenase n=1 Tax=uncultured Aquimarina sp. TaxID=575652 RepID=UPI00262244CE|nr:Iota-carrageenase [uncultured Aquimarina sp.]